MKSLNPGKPRIAAKICIPPEKLREWFDDALRADDPKPSLVACEKLAREFQVILNRQNNEELERDPTLPLWNPRDISQEEWVQKIMEEFRVEANRFLAKVEELEELKGLLGSKPWGKNRPSLDEIRAPLIRIGFAPIVREPPAVTRGRPREAWHAAVLSIAWAIKNALKKEGYRGSLNAKDEKSVVANIGAATISWAYQIAIEPAGFASAAQGRDRKKGKRARSVKEFLAMFPKPAKFL